MRLRVPRAVTWRRAPREEHVYSRTSAFDLRLLDSGEGVLAGLAVSPLGPWSPRPRSESQEQGRLGGKSLENLSHRVQMPSAISAPSSCRKKGWTASRSLCSWVVVSRLV